MDERNQGQNPNAGQQEQNRESGAAMQQNQQNREQGQGGQGATGEVQGGQSGMSGGVGQESAGDQDREAGGTDDAA